MFVSHIRAIGSTLGRTVSVFNDAVGSWTSRVAPQLTRVSELNGDDDYEVIEPIDEAVRDIQTDSYALAAGSSQN